MFVAIPALEKQIKDLEEKVKKLKFLEDENDNMKISMQNAKLMSHEQNRDEIGELKKENENLKKKIAELEDRSDLVIGQRGKGLLRAVILRDDIAADVVGKGISQGLLSNPVRPNAIRLMPPLTVTEEELDDAFGIIETVLQEFE